MYLSVKVEAAVNVAMEKDTLPPDKLPQSAASTDADCQPGHASASQITNNHSLPSFIIPGMFCATCTSN